MKVCIAGGGRVGMYLAQSLLSHRHKVTIIEPPCGYAGYPGHLRRLLEL